jgi:hypothetical protein
MRIALLITGVGLRNPSSVVFVADDIAQIVLDWSIDGTGPGGKAISCAAARMDTGGT